MSEIPKVLHYVFGMAEDFGGKPWSLVHHVCVASAIERIKPKAVYLYYAFEPGGPWWALTRAQWQPVPIEAPASIFGNALNHVAHKTDVVRLQTLQQLGGIYLDADVLVQAPFDDLLGHSTVLGQEGEDGAYGLANAVIIAERGAPFLKRWLEEYRSFRSTGRDKYWSEHSVQIPKRLAREHPDEVTVLGPGAFYRPLWTPPDLERIFTAPYDAADRGQYANHLWETKAWAYLSGLTPGQVRRGDTNFCRWSAPMLDSLPDDYGADWDYGREFTARSSIT